MNNESLVSQIDRQNMREFILDLPNQLKMGTRLAKNLDLPENYKSIRNCLVLGMGGSLIGGAISKELVSNKSKVPIELINNSQFPKYANENSLVLAISFSGNTQEVLSAAAVAHRQKCKMVAVTTGGKLSEFCKKHRIPQVNFNYASQPRAAVGIFLAVILGIFGELKLLDEKISFSEVDIKPKQKEAKEIAESIADKDIIVCAGEFLTPLAKRFKNSLNENAKITAQSEEMPEFFHNMLEGLSKGKTYVIFNSNSYSSHLGIQTGNFLKILKEKKLNFVEIRPVGKNLLEKTLNALQLTDLICFYVAILREKDPTPIQIIEKFKK